MNNRIIDQHVRTIADFPIPGIQFKDWTPLLKNPQALRTAVLELVRPCQVMAPSAIIVCEARGFILGSLVAWELGCPIVPLRKPGKLPATTHQVDYKLEYAQASLEIHEDALTADDQVVIVDDLLATGGTVEASCRLVQTLGAKVLACSFLIELQALQGRTRLCDGIAVHSVLRY